MTMKESKKFNYRPIVLVFLAVASIVILLALNLEKPFFAPVSLEQLKTGQAAPDFSFPGLDGKMVRLSDYRGKVVLVNIWATWCPPCVDEMPSMETLYQKFKGKSFEILAVSVDEAGVTAVAPFMKKHKLTFPALIDSKATIRTTYGITGVPESFIIDKNGILIKKIIGPIDWADIEVIGFFRNIV